MADLCIGTSAFTAKGWDGSFYPVIRQNSATAECHPLSLAKMLSGANAFEISDIQEAETEGAVTSRSGCNNVALR
jgi:hypothetical protein